MKNIIRRNSWQTAMFFMLIALVLALRVYYIFDVPSRTTDILRHLGFTSHLWELGPSIYKYKASDFFPEIWADLWPGVGYIYPPFTMVFFAIVGFFSKSIVVAKAALSLCDIVSSILLAKITNNKWMGLVLFAMPNTIWWTSHEGQFESLHLMLMLASVYFALNSNWVKAGLFLAFGIQTKIFSLLLMPVYFFYIFTSIKQQRLNYLQYLFFGLASGFLLFVPFYIEKPLLLLSPLLDNTTRLFNPHWWNIFDERFFKYNPTWLIFWNSIFELSILGILVFWWLKKYKSEFLLFLSPVSFLVILKSLSWGHFWYPIQFPGTLATLAHHKRLFAVVLFLAFFQDGRALALIAGFEHGRFERLYLIERMTSCMKGCNLQRVDDKALSASMNEYAIAKRELKEKSYQSCHDRMLSVLAFMPGKEEYVSTYFDCFNPIKEKLLKEYQR